MRANLDYLELPELEFCFLASFWYNLGRRKEQNDD
jgi:hypothetical protein